MAACDEVCRFMIIDEARKADDVEQSSGGVRVYL
jgi:hypothetical protein